MNFHKKYNSFYSSKQWQATRDYIRQQSGKFYQGNLKQTKEYGTILTNLRHIDIGVNGISDLQYLGEGGKSVFLEVKTATGKASPEQLNFIEQVKALGFKAGVVRSVEDARELVK